MKYITRQTLIFLIVDEQGFSWSIAPTKLDARTQIKWFLPRGKSYKIVPTVIPKDVPLSVDSKT